MLDETPVYVTGVWHPQAQDSVLSPFKEAHRRLASSMSAGSAPTLPSHRRMLAEYNGHVDAVILVFNDFQPYMPPVSVFQAPADCDCQ